MTQHWKENETVNQLTRYALFLFSKNAQEVDKWLSFIILVQINGRNTISSNAILKCKKKKKELKLT